LKRTRHPARRIPSSAKATLRAKDMKLKQSAACCVPSWMPLGIVFLLIAGWSMFATLAAEHSDLRAVIASVFFAGSCFFMASYVRARRRRQEGQAHHGRDAP